MKAYGYDWHQTTVGRIEAAQRPLRLNEAVDLAALFGVSLETLLTRTQRELDVVKLRDRIARLRARQRHAEQAFTVVQAELERAATHEHEIQRTVEVARADMAAAQGEIDSLTRALAQLERLNAEHPA
jgi:chromosome segregation ATPase